MNINNLVTKYIKSHEIFKSSDLIDYLVEESDKERKNVSNFVYVSLNRMKSGSDNLGREVTKIKSGVYVNKKLSIQDIWELERKLERKRKENISGQLKNLVINKKLVTSGVTFAFENGFRESRPSIKTYTSSSYSNMYKELDLMQIINYSYIEYSKNIKASFVSVDELLLRRIISSLSFIDYSKKVSMDNFINYLERHDIDFYKFITACLKNYKTNLEKKDNLERLLRRKVFSNIS